MRPRRLPVLGRRELFRWAGAAGASTLVPVAGCSSTPAVPEALPTVANTPPAKAYLSSEDAAIVNALADAVLPPDDVPGGSALGVVSYIETLLTAFHSSPPMIYAGGPYSGRESTPGADGSPSGSFPPDDFRSFLPLDRFQTKAWQLRIYGSAGVTGGGPNDAITGPVIGLRDAVATAVMLAKAAMPQNASVTELTQDDKVSMLKALDKVTQATLIELVLEGCFTAPEYGGNTNQAGWKMMSFEGDSQPLGYSWYDTTKNAYTEDPDHPVSTPTPGDDPMPMSAATLQLISQVITILGGTVFP